MLMCYSVSGGVPVAITLLFETDCVCGFEDPLPEGRKDAKICFYAALQQKLIKV